MFLTSVDAMDASPLHRRGYYIQWARDSMRPRKVFEWLMQSFSGLHLGAAPGAVHVSTDRRADEKMQRTFDVKVKI